ncbi:1-deoxy-D-xylulose-5-phosphate reductoisomerase [Clostridium sp. SYSU_GA19001]|uniref:1-deoxy-D-xylulose-5-phosphate reductoisomerase n=1 Tax=Clostridium caldaquaticum TaxID=2940653 RepID=UPI0020776106|nr:1-deoxy-D-xylulose-5-phosphate reductoisomerase [Clostridium caldaquaticum]MCM8710620.1 1-deoxy-D-xylulose-5-phosphate reductoisomerase [Clostridium caldaquaticum]
MKNITILGATGSIGSQTLDVIRKEKNKFKLIGISSNKNYHKTIDIIKEFSPKYVAVMDKITYENIKEYCKINNLSIEVIYGMEGLNIVATLPEVDMIVTSIVGMIGLVPTINAIKSGKHIALANKETLVVGGEIVKAAAHAYNVMILPVDSEHGAIFQCLQGNKREDVNRVILTASGGPFRGKKLNDLCNVSADEALKHPKWNMGKKISIDSATLMNKGLEVIEAHWLFDMDYNDIDVVIHPQSIIHSMVEYNDGSVIAQLGTTDMRLPIQYALNYPCRRKTIVDRLDFYNLGNLTFEMPDFETFKCLKLAYEAGKTGGTCPTILNSANEAAVELFLQKKISFLQIANIIEECMNKFSWVSKFTIEDILETNENVRRYIYNKYVLNGGI